MLEQLGHYDPIEKDKDKQLTLNLERVRHWLDVGAIPSETVSTLCKRSGLEHKMLRLPRPGKPKPKEGEAKEAKKDEAAGGGAEGGAEDKAE